MAKYIDADKMIATLEFVKITSPDNQQMCSVADAFEGIINDTKAADVVEVRRGRWEPQTRFGSVVKCSVCGNVTSTEWGFCPHCGADMREEK